MKISDVSLTESISMISDKDWQTVLTLVPPNAKRNLMLNEPRDRLVGTVCRLLSDIKAHVGGEYAENAKQIAELLMPYALKEIDRALTLSASQDWLSFSGANALAKAFSEYIPAIKAVVEKHRSTVVKHIVATANEDPGAVKAEIAFVNRLGLDWPELDSVVYPAFETHLLNLFDNNQAIKTLYKIVFVLDEIGITLNKLSRLEKVIDNFKEQLLWYNNTEISDMLWARIKAFMHNVKVFNRAGLSWPELDNPTAYLKSHFEADKTNTVKKLLGELRTNTAAQFVLNDVDALRAVGITWPELDIVERSMNKDINRPQLNEADKQFDQTVVDQLNAILPKPMRSRLESVNRFFYIAYFIDFLFDLQKARFSESKKYQAFDLLKPIVYEYIEHYINRLNDPRFAFTHFIDVIERLEKLNKEYVEFDYTELFERNKSSIIKMLLGSVRNYMETPDNVGRWRTYESYINFAKLISKLGLSWPELNKIVSSLASDRYVRVLDRPHSTLGAIADLVSGMKRDHMTLQKLMPNARAKIEGAKDRFINRNYFSFRWRDDIKFELDNTLIRYFQDLKTIGFEWPEIDQYLAASTTRERAELQKRPLVSSMLAAIKAGEADGVPHGIKTLRTMGIDWPELAVIERSIRSVPTDRLNEAIDLNTATEKQQIAAVRRNHNRIKSIRNPSEAVQIAAAKANGYALAYYIRNPSEAVQLAAVNQTGNAIQFINNPSEAVQLAAATQNGLAIRYIEHPSEAVQLAAVQQDASALEYIHKPSDAVQIAAIKQNVNAIEQLENPSVTVLVTAILVCIKNNKISMAKLLLHNLKNQYPDAPEVAKLDTVLNAKQIDEAFDINAASDAEQIAALKKNRKGVGIEWITNPSEAVQLAAVKKNPWQIRHIKNPSDAVQIAAVEKADVYSTIRNPGEAVKLAMVSRYGKSIRKIKDPSEAVQLAAVQNDSAAIKYIKDPSDAVQLAAMKKDVKLLSNIDNPSAAVLVTAILICIKNNKIGMAQLLLHNLKNAHPNAPEISKLDTVLNAKQIKETKMSDELYRHYASDIAYHIQTGDPAIALRYMGDRNITIDDLDEKLRKELEASKADAIRWLLKLFEHDIFRFGRFIEPINRVKLDWPELAVLNRSFDSEYQKREDEFRRHRQY